MIGNYTCQLLLGLHCNPWQASLGNPFKFAVAYVKIRHAVATHTPHIIGRSRSKSHQINRTAPCHLTLGKIDIESSILDSRRESISLSRIEVRNTILFLCKPRVRFGFCNLCQRHFGSALMGRGQKLHPGGRTRFFGNNQRTTRQILCELYPYRLNTRLIFWRTLGLSLWW